jgi:hypothetical protein
MIEIDRRIASIRGGVHVNYLNIFTDRSRLEVSLPGDVECGLVESFRVEPQAKRRIEGEDTQ